MKRFGPLLPVLLVAIGGLLAYSNTFHVPFVFDDETEIVSKPLIRDLGNYLGSWAGYGHNANRVLGYFTFALNYRANGLEPPGWHAVNLAVHLGAALLVHALVVLTFRTPWLRRSALAASHRAVALAAALLFVAHPIQTQAVTYVVQRLTSLSTLLYLAAVVLYAHWRLAREAGSARGPAGLARFAAVLAVALLAMKTKEIAATLPLAIALYELAFFEGSWRTRLAWLAPVLAMLVVVPVSTFGLHRPVGQILSDVSDLKVQTAMTRLDYLRTELAVIATYLRLVVLPVGQNLDWDFPKYSSFVAPRVLLAGLLHLALLATVAVAWGGRTARRFGRTFDPAARLVSFGILWFFLALSVESSIVPIVDVLVEHRVYLPSAGLFSAIAAAGALAARRLAPRRWAAATIAAAVALSAVLGVATWRRNAVWGTELSIWADAVSKSPRKSRPHDNLGLAYVHLDRVPEAFAHFQEAVRLDPTNVRAWNNLGVASAKLGHTDDARVAFQAALRLDPEHAESIYNLGRILLVQEGRYAESIPYFERAIRIRADYAEAYASLAAAWNALGRFPDTVRVLTAAGNVIRSQPHARFNLGVAYAATGDGAAAQGEVQALRQLDPQLAARLAEFVASGGRGGR
jgi:Flp pilus assembly protein TadD